ncbi:MAG: NAD(P)-dependent oxidoreductase [Acidimicrobiia bacterium]|nr:NAD(P)-dependent oxidoreductase [Acidimicrobiia bacterium]
MKVLVLGATGVAGRSTLPRLTAAGHDVVAHVRRPAARRAVETIGAQVVEGDSFDPGHLRAWMRGCDAVIDLRVSIPDTNRAAWPGAWREYARLRGHGCGRVVDAALDAGVTRVVRDTVTMTYAGAGDRWIDEDHATRASGALAANLVAEGHLARLTAAGGTGVAVRFGGFYGPDDEFSRDLIAATRKGRAPIIGDPDGYTSAVHTGDIGSALLVALSAPAGVYNAVDDEPLTRAALLEVLARSSGRERVKAYPSWAARLASSPVRALTRSQRVSNGRLKAVGWQPTVASRRTGWPDAFSRFQPEGGVSR